VADDITGASMVPGRQLENNVTSRNDEMVALSRRYQLAAGQSENRVVETDGISKAERKDNKHLLLVRRNQVDHHLWRQCVLQSAVFSSTNVQTTTDHGRDNLTSEHSDLKRVMEMSLATPSLLSRLRKLR
jgi:hypothetical protein